MEFAWKLDHLLGEIGAIENLNQLDCTILELELN